VAAATTRNREGAAYRRSRVAGKIGGSSRRDAVRRIPGWSAAVLVVLIVYQGPGAACQGQEPKAVLEGKRKGCLCEPIASQAAAKEARRPIIGERVSLAGKILDFLKRTGR
jgi:hypothetical protein